MNLGGKKVWPDGLGSVVVSEYSTFDFGVSSASDSGEVTVIGPSGAMWIEGVHTKPNSTIKAGDIVSFNVLVSNSYSSSKQVELDLFIDGKEVDFTNPTGVQWNITRIDTDAHVLKTPRTKDLTIEPTKTIITHTVPLGGVGEFELEFHDVLPQSGFIETGLEVKKLSGVRVPVQVNFTVFDNGHPYVVTSQEGIFDLVYTATKYVEIKVELNSIVQHIVADTVAGVVIGAGAGAIVGSIVPGAGTMAGATAGAVIGGTLGFIYGVIWHGVLGRP